MDCGEEFYELEKNYASLPAGNCPVGAKPRKGESAEDFSRGAAGVSAGIRGRENYMSTTPSLQLLCRQDVPLPRFFHLLQVPAGEQLPPPCGHGDGCSEMSAVFVTSDQEPVRTPMCERHANLTHAEWIVNL